MRKIRLTNTSDDYFPDAWSLYNDAFPSDERRLLSHQIEILSLNYYHFEVLLNENDFIGIVLWWEFEDLKFIEHLAIQPSQRAKGYGKEILSTFITRDNRPVLLEVELPENKINENRILFYQKLGFKLNYHSYSQPSMRIGSQPVELYLMSFPDPISEELVSNFILQYHPRIYR
jgi:GNAT superfamily N-acetyltransferase